MTSTDYLDAVERLHAVTAVTLSPAPGCFVGMARVPGGAELWRTSARRTPEGAALALAQMCGATKHCGDAGVTVDLRATGDAWTLHYRTGSTPGNSPLDAVAHALRIARWHEDNERVLRERVAL